MSTCSLSLSLGLTPLGPGFCAAASLGHETNAAVTASPKVSLLKLFMLISLWIFLLRGEPLKHRGEEQNKCGVGYRPPCKLARAERRDKGCCRPSFASSS